MSAANGKLLGFRLYQSSHGVSHVRAVLVEGRTAVFNRPLCTSRAGRCVLAGVVIDEYAVYPLREVFALMMRRRYTCTRCLARAERALDMGTITLEWNHHTL